MFIFEFSKLQPDGVVELVVHEASDDAGFTYGLVTQEYKLSVIIGISASGFV